MATQAEMKAEIASIARDPYLPQYAGVLGPQDPTLAARGGAAGVALYDEIRRDPHAHAVLQKRALEVTSREWQVIAASDRRADKRAADLVERALRRIDFDRLTRGLLGATLYGFAVAEVIWEVVAGEWLPQACKVRRQRRFRFDAAENLRLLTRESGFDGIVVPARKFIVHRYALDHTDDDPYGLGLGSVLYWPAWFKRQVLGHWLQAVERHAEPDLKLTYQGQYNRDLEQQLLATAVSRARNKVMALPDSVQAELLESASNGGADALSSLSRYLDEMLSVAVLGETLSTSGGDNGSRALGEVHNDVRLAIAKADADLLSATIHQSLVRWLVDINMPGAGYPAVWRDFSQVEDLDKRADRDVKIKGMGYRPRNVDYINETYGGDWVETTPPPAPAQDPTAVPGGARAALAAAFAEAGTDIDPLAPMVDRLAAAAQPSISAMIDRIRAEMDRSSDLADFAQRLLALSPDLSIDELGDIMSEAMQVAHLAGRASVVDEVGHGD